MQGDLVTFSGIHRSYRLGDIVCILLYFPAVGPQFERCDPGTYASAAGIQRDLYRRRRSGDLDQYQMVQGRRCGLPSTKAPALSGAG